jgi:putative DNA primase/helicase
VEVIDYSNAPINVSAQTKAYPDPSHELRAAMEAAGLRTNDPIAADGTLHRFHVDGDKPGSQNGWYALYADNMPAAAFGSWKTGEQHTWCPKPERAMSFGERAEFKRNMDKAREQRRVEQGESRRAARERANAIWRDAPLAKPCHPYLERKRVKPHGIRQFGDDLMIPIRDAGGVLHSLQFIGPDGDKRFLPGGAIRGHFHVIGNPPGRALLICEGYATGATLFEATGYPAIVAFSAKNLSPVAQAMRAAFPKSRIVLCADNDCETPGNPGVTEATKAAKLVNGRIAVPYRAGVAP